MSSLDYFLISNGPAITQYPDNSFINYCLVSALCVAASYIFQKECFAHICVHWGQYKTHLFLRHVHFQTFYALYTMWKELKQLQPWDQHHQQSKTGNSLVQTSPPPEELLTEVREQLIQPSLMEQIPSIQDFQQDSQVFEIEHLLHLHTPNISTERTYSSPVICND